MRTPVPTSKSDTLRSPPLIATNDPSAVPAPPATWPRLPPKVRIGSRVSRSYCVSSPPREPTNNWSVTVTTIPRKSVSVSDAHPFAGLSVEDHHPCAGTRNDPVTGAADVPRHEPVDGNRRAVLQRPRVEAGEGVVGAVAVPDEHPVLAGVDGRCPRSGRRAHHDSVRHPFTDVPVGPELGAGELDRAGLQRDAEHGVGRRPSSGPNRPSKVVVDRSVGRVDEADLVGGRRRRRHLARGAGARPSG